MKTHWETDTRVQPLVASLEEAKKPLDGNDLDSTEHVSWKELQHHCFTHLAIF